MTLTELLQEFEDYNITYAEIGGMPKNFIVQSAEEVVTFISENIFDINLLLINDINIDVNRIIEKYKI